MGELHKQAGLKSRVQDIVEFVQLARARMGRAAGLATEGCPPHNHFTSRNEERKTISYIKYWTTICIVDVNHFFRVAKWDRRFWFLPHNFIWKENMVHKRFLPMNVSWEDNIIDTKTGVINEDLFGSIRMATYQLQRFRLSNPEKKSMLHNKCACRAPANE